MKVTLSQWEREAIVSALWFCVDHWPRDPFRSGREQWANWLSSLNALPNLTRRVEMDEAQIKEIADCLAYFCADQDRPDDLKALLVKMAGLVGRTPAVVDVVLDAASAIVRPPSVTQEAQS